MQLDGRAPPRRVSELSSYDWASSRRARTSNGSGPARSRDARPAVRHEAGLENATDEDRAAINDAVRLNDLPRPTAAGEDTADQFQDFMDKHGDFSGGPAAVEELIDALFASGRRSADLNSMTAEQRATMQLSQAFGSPERCSRCRDSTPTSSRCAPVRTGRARAFRREQGLGLGDGTGVLRTRRPRRAAEQRSGHPGPGWTTSTRPLDRQLGEQAAVDARTLAELERALRDSLSQARHRRTAAPSQGARQLGKALLRDVATRMSGRQGSATCRPGGGEQSGTTGSGLGDTEPGMSPARSPTPYAVPPPKDAPPDPCASTSATSRSRRPRPAPRRRSRCWSTRRSRWPWTGAGCP